MDAGAGCTGAAAGADSVRRHWLEPLSRVNDGVVRYGERLVDDILNRTETAASQAETSLAMQLALEAETNATRV